MSFDSRPLVATIAAVVWRDGRDSWRSLRGAPGFALAALVMLAFAIALNTAIFTVINAVLFRPLPVRAPHELAFLWRTAPLAPDREHGLGTYEEVRRFVATPELFSGGAGMEPDTGTLRIGTEAERLIGERVSASYFDVLGVAPMLGRTLVAADADIGAPRAIVISHALWRRRFSADPGVIGLRIALGTALLMSDSVPRYTIVGVMGPEFTGVANRWAGSDYWVEFSQREHDTYGILVNRSVTIGMAVARMRPGVTADRVRASAAASLPTREVVVRPSGAPGTPGPHVGAAPLAKLPFGGGTIAPARLGAGLIVVSALVLAIGATNLAGLAMARGVARRRDAGIRMALGATHWDIARQLVTEHLLLGLAAGIIGVGLSRVFVRTFLDNMAIGFGAAARAGALDVPLDRRVFLFTLLLSISAGMVVGLAAARRYRRVSVLQIAPGESLGAPAIARSRRRHWILVPQLALSLALVLVALTAVRALLNVALVPSGYEADRVGYLTFEGLYRPLQLMTSGEKDTYYGRLRTFPERIFASASTVPGLETAVSSRLPTDPGGRVEVSTPDGLSGRHQSVAAGMTRVTARYFGVVGIPLVNGRTFDDRELTTSRPVAVVDESLAARLWPGQNPLGRMFSLPGGRDPQVRYEVVGVVGTIRDPLAEGEPPGALYLPFPQEATQELFLLARGPFREGELLAVLHEVTKEADREIGVLQSGMLSTRIAERRYPRRIAAELLGFCAAGGLLLAATGLYGVLSFAVAQRRREFGIRTALGAGRGRITRLVIGEGTLVAGIGSILGIPLALLGLRLASHYVLPIPPMDTWTLCLAPLVVGVVAILACYIPARRASQVNPIEVLRAL